ncbi:hypothetical protein NQ317_009708 [Molorchus minor]|uniref:Uncharacterized protein n=1 Tax=Molorchus minor TaxID=1323400 RepID=A0ABQ9JN98_9CUCU|nr:hypothetical protein NQ317_009708 [Molorchus minor]
MSGNYADTVEYVLLVSLGRFKSTNITEKSKKVKSFTLWAMLKSTINIKGKVDFKKFTNLVPYLKKLSVGNHPKKSKVLTREEVNHFIREAYDETYLMVKVHF